MAKPKLIFLQEPFTNREYELRDTRILVGRDPTCGLIIHHDTISHQHCEIHVHGSEIIVRDLGSKNGTLVHGVRLRDGQAQLKHGEIVSFGSVQARLEFPSRPEEEDQTDTNITVASLFTRYQDENPQAQGATGKPCAETLEASSANKGSPETQDDASEQTVFMARPQVASTPMLDEDEPDLKGQAQGRRLIWIAAVILALAVLIIILVKPWQN